MRSIKQPGPPIAERIQWVEVRGRAFSFRLEAGLPLLEAARRGFAAEGFAGGTLNMSGGALGPFGYVMPALSKTGENAAFYSDTFRPSGVTRLKLATMTLGARDGAPFFHCHGLWREADGRMSGGHMLPEETHVAEPFEVQAFGIDGAVFEAEPDPETEVQAVRPRAGEHRRVRMRPAAPLRCGCGRTRISPAAWKPSAASMALRGHASMAASARPSARVSLTARSSSPLRRSWRSPRASLPPMKRGLIVALIDYTGGIGEGRLIRGDNPVLMTMELVLEAV